VGKRSPHSPVVLALFKHDITLTEIADARGVTHSAVSQWCSGKVRPPSDLLDTIAEIGGRLAAQEVAEALKQVAT